MKPEIIIIPLDKSMDLRRRDVTHVFIYFDGNNFGITYNGQELGGLSFSKNEMKQIVKEISSRLEGIA
jgi:hypothetical protein